MKIGKTILTLLVTFWCFEESFIQVSMPKSQEGYNTHLLEKHWARH